MMLAPRLARRTFLAAASLVAARARAADEAVTIGVFGRVQFDPETRRVRHPASIDLVVKHGAFALWDGKPAAAG